eukprot:3529679-Prymnesium_polylepis.1
MPSCSPSCRLAPTRAAAAPSPSLCAHGSRGAEHRRELLQVGDAHGRRHRSSVREALLQRERARRRRTVGGGPDVVAGLHIESAQQLPALRLRRGEAPRVLDYRTHACRARTARPHPWTRPAARRKQRASAGKAMQRLSLIHISEPTRRS